MIVTSGQKCFELSKSLSPLGLLVKMLLTSKTWHSKMRVLIWKVRDMKSRRLIYQLSPLMRHTEETDCGYWPTMTARDGRDFSNPTPTQKRAVIKRDSPSLALILTIKWDMRLSPKIYEWTMGYPIGWTELKD